MCEPLYAYTDTLTHTHAHTHTHTHIYMLSIYMCLPSKLKSHRRFYRFISFSHCMSWKVVTCESKTWNIYVIRNGIQNWEISFSVSVQENLILPTDNIRVLGVTLDDHLKFDAHITNICIAASRQINALKRLSKYLNERSRVLIYKSFISSNFNYCPVTWMFCGGKNVTKLEKLQERALRFVFKDNNSSYADLLKRGNFLSLSAYRIRNLAMEVFKCFHGMNHMYLNNLFCKQDIKYDLTDKTLLEQPKFSTKTYGYRSFKYYGSKLWNALPFWNKEHGKLWWIQIKINYLVPFKRSWQTWNILTSIFSFFFSK